MLCGDFQCIYVQLFVVRVRLKKMRFYCQNSLVK